MKTFWLLTALAVSLRAGLLVPGPYRVEVIQRVPVTTPHERGFYRTACCPSGIVVLTHSAGDVTVIAGSGAVLYQASGVEAFRNVTASTCDAADQLWVAGAGVVRRFAIGASGEPRFQQSIWVSGGANALLVTRERLYLLGLARVEGKHVFLRAFRLPDGEQCGILPVHDEPGQEFADLGSVGVQLILNGGLFAYQDDVVYMRGNPFEFRRYTPEGRLVSVKRPSLSWFENKSPQTLRSMPPRWWSLAADWARKVVALPDGRVLVQVLLSPGPARALRSESYLVLFDSDLEVQAEKISVPNWGLLEGADREGNLWFSRLGVGGSRLIKARLLNQ